MVIDRICATSVTMPWSVPIFSGSCKGIVMTWTGGPSFSQPPVASPLADCPIAEAFQRPDQPIRGYAARQTSCCFDWNQFVLDVVQLHHARTDGGLLKVQ